MIKHKKGRKMEKDEKDLQDFKGKSPLHKLIKSNKFLNDSEFSKRAMDMYEERVENDKDLDAFTFLNYKKFDKNLAPRFDARLIKTYSHPDNQKKISDILVNAYQRKFGRNAQYCYGVSDDMFYYNMITSTPATYHLESKIFPHNETFRVAIQEAPKIPVEDWIMINDDPDYRLYSKRVLFKLGQQVMTGEVIKKEVKKYFENFAKNSMVFLANYRGMEDYKFIVDRWDYKPYADHYNFFDKFGKYSYNGAIMPFANYSHRHPNTFRHRSIFGPFFSPDIRPTPPNSLNIKRMEEKIYTDFKSMELNFLDTFNVYDAHIPSRMLECLPLREIGNQLCPSFSVAQDYGVESVPDGFYDVIKDKNIDPRFCEKRLDTDNMEGLYLASEKYRSRHDDDFESQFNEPSPKKSNKYRNLNENYYFSERNGNYGKKFNKHEEEFER